MAAKALLTRTVKDESMSAKTRYFRKCVACNGQGKRVTRGNGHTVTISCTCEGGFVDCTKEIEAALQVSDSISSLLQAIAQSYKPRGSAQQYCELVDDWQIRAQTILNSMLK